MGGRSRHALSESANGHPPVPGYSPGLLEGHPVCPAGRDRPGILPHGAWDGQDNAQGLIST
jgi:hypothetical protein